MKPSPTFSVERMAAGGTHLRIRAPVARRHRSPRRSVKSVPNRTADCNNSLEQTAVLLKMNKIFRFVLALLAAGLALITFAAAPWGLAYEGFSWPSTWGLIVLAAVVFGSVLVWITWRLIQPVISLRDAKPEPHGPANGSQPIRSH